MTSAPKKVVRNEAYEAFLKAPDTLDLGQRLKKVRDEPIEAGGRIEMVLFEDVDGGRPHPRMRFSWRKVDDPNQQPDLFTPATAPTSATALRQAISDALRQHLPILTLEDIPDEAVPKESPHYWRNQVRIERTNELFTSVRNKLEGWVADGTMPKDQEDACLLAIAELEDETYAGSIQFDDADTGTYHSYQHDAPFVHYLESLIASLPEEGSESMAVLHSATRESVRRQREQLLYHLDYLMRNKYAYEVIEETDIERTLGGFLIDCTTRQIVSEVPDCDPLEPTYEVLKIRDDASHEHKGKWIYRDDEGKLRLSDDHAEVTVDAKDVESSARTSDELTFRRAPHDPHLRENLRFDWDENGWVQQGRVDWVSWAGHCDIKAVLEQLGLTLTTEPKPFVKEYRSDTGQTLEYNRDLILEMIASVIELGSNYSRVDRTGQLQRGIMKFGGSRNDSQPDRLQFMGEGQGKHFRWPLGGRSDTFRVTGIELPDGSRPDMGTVFFRYLPDTEAVTFSDNPRYLKTVEGDYNLIDVSGAKIEARIKTDAFDPMTGYPIEQGQSTVIDLRPGADAGEEGRFFLGTNIEDVGERKLLRYYYEPANNRIVGEAEIYTKDAEGGWTAKPKPEDNVELALVSPLTATLSREMKRDDPSQFSTLLDLALRQGINICTDTDKESAVWNGVITRIDVRKVGANAQARTEHWRVDITARFGQATLEYLMRRDARGKPEAYCPAVSESHWARWPDFLWHDVPDIGSKGKQDGQWIVNEAMVDLGLVEIREDESIASGHYIFDDHIKNTFELIFAALAGYKHTVVHNNKRYGFLSPEDWQEAVDGLGKLRSALTFADVDG